VLVGPQGFGNTQQYERELAIIRQTHEPAFRVIPVVLPKTGSDLPFDFLRNLTRVDFSQVERVSNASDELERLLRAVQGGPTAGDEARQVIRPWRGLDAFREEDPALFFGRGSVGEPESPIGQLVRKVREHRFVMVVGRSGSGKSSLVFAGLVPALECRIVALALDAGSTGQSGKDTRGEGTERKAEDVDFATAGEGLDNELVGPPARSS
jgi:hypothetical protein